jgi:hypothetical protein
MKTQGPKALNQRGIERAWPRHALGIARAVAHLIDTIEKIHATDEPHRTRLRFRRKFQTIASCRPCRTAPTFAAAA